MALTSNAFDTFHRPSFQMKKLKAIMKPEEVGQLMREHKAAYEEWKGLIQQVASNVADLGLSFDGDDSYQRGFVLRNRFWFRFKMQSRMDSGSCLAVMVNKDGIEVYLEWHETLKGKTDNVTEHNQVLHRIAPWAEDTKLDPLPFIVQTDVRNSKSGPLVSLEEYLKDESVRTVFDKFLSERIKSWIIVGQVIPKKAVFDSEKLADDVADALRLLLGLYLVPESKYWLFNVYYDKEPSVWDQCKKWQIAAMQYEPDRETPSSVTRNVKRAKLMGKGDRIVAYTGNQGFLAMGTITRTYYEENDPARYLQLESGGGRWRQRVGVDWFLQVPKPVRLGSNFKETLGITEPMGSHVVFEIGKQAYQEIRKLFTDEQGGPLMIGSTLTFAHYVRARGFRFKEDILHRYELSLRAKPFVILSGISGTGKTKIAQLFAEYMSSDYTEFKELSNDEFSMVYMVQPYNHKYKRLIIPKKYEPLITLPPKGESSEIKVVMEDFEDMGRIYMDANGKYSSLHFKGAFAKEFLVRFPVGKKMRVTFDKQDDVEIIRFTKIDPAIDTKQVPVSQHAFISVRPDWVDHHSLLGYYNPLTEQYQLTPFLKLLLRAVEDKERRPHFVILDEMNLAKVEYYFSDFLSCLESRRLGEHGRIVSEPIQLHDVYPLTVTDEDGLTYVIPSMLEIPDNLFFTGTVNVDETTYMFSPKVLDRANVIEFNEVDLEGYRSVLEQSTLSMGEVARADEESIQEFTNYGQYHSNLIAKSFSGSTEMKQAYDWIVDLHSLLTPYQMHFGYRVIDEILMFLTQAEVTGYFPAKKALDYQIIQRILPKYHGNRKKLQSVLQGVLYYCSGWSVKDIRLGLPLKIGETVPEIRFRESATKIEQMLQKLDNTGFVSFIE